MLSNREGEIRRLVLELGPALSNLPRNETAWRPLDAIGPVLRRPWVMVENDYTFVLLDSNT